MAGGFRREELPRCAEGGGIGRCRSHRIGCRCGDRTGLRGQAMQVLVSEPREAADAVSLPDGLAQQPQACDVGVRVHPAAIIADGGHGAMTALPSAQRVDGDSGQPGDRPDRVTRG